MKLKINIDKVKIEKSIRGILFAIGENPNREGLKDTPKRVANMFSEIFAGIHKDPKKEIILFSDETHEEMIILKDIPFYSMCEHHLLPFIGKAHVAYIPQKGKLLGLSKISRIVDTLAKKPQVQERLTSEIADLLEKHVFARGVLVIIEAEHLCMTMRGIKKPGSIMVTSAVRGLLKESGTTRSEALSLINKNNSSI